MKRKKSDVLRLVAELQSDMSILDDLTKKNKKARQRIERGSVEELDWAALGSTIHNIYNLFESYFLRISKFFENVLDPVTWHRDLIQHMTLEIEEVRPALFDRELAGRIDELRSFHHVFRNIYQSELDPKRVELVQQRLDATLSSFKKAHNEFIEKTKTIAEQLKE